eukprot:scaffold164_cov340-Pinguiococcus_pyrenoidosus.AAC.3
MTEIVSDCDPRFTSEWWTSLAEALSIKLRMTVTYRPEADGQAERKRQACLARRPGHDRVRDEQHVASSRSRSLRVSGVDHLSPMTSDAAMSRMREKAAEKEAERAMQEAKATKKAQKKEELWQLAFSQ